MNITQKEATMMINEVCRESFTFFIERVFYEVERQSSFVYGEHIDAICDYIIELINGNIYGLNITIPPRSLKSIICSISFPIYVLGRDPRKKVFVMSFSQARAEEFTSKCKSTMETNWYKQLFPDTILKKFPNRNEYFETTQGGFIKAYHIGSESITGDGADFLVLDDGMPPFAARSDAERTKTLEYIKSTVLSRGVSGQRLKVINVMQRTHEDDLVAMFKNNKDFITLELPAEFHKITTITTPKRIIAYNKGDVLQPKMYLNDPQYPNGYKSYLQNQKKEMGEWNYACQYLLSPAPLEGGLIKKSSFKWYDEKTQPNHFQFVIHSWDTAFTVTTTAAFTCGTVWGITERGLYLLHVVNERLDSTDLEKIVKNLGNRDKPYRILIENKASGIGLIQSLQKTTYLPIEAINLSGTSKENAETNPKKIRFDFAKRYIDTGKVFLPIYAPWLDDYLKQLLTFPQSTYADMVDSTSQFCKWYSENEHYILNLLANKMQSFSMYDKS